MGASGAVGLNWLAVKSMALSAGVPKDELLDFWDKLSLMASIVLSEQYKEQERNRQQKKQKK